MWARLLPALLVAARVAPGVCGDDEKESEGGTPIYDIAHHTWGYQEDSKKDATFLLAFVVLVVVSLLVSWVVSHRWKVEVFPEACVVLTVGLMAGFACKFFFAETHRGFFSRPLLGFDNALFFLGLLPPIIFHSGYELRPRWLFGLFWQIMGFALLGTFASSLFVAVVLKAASFLGWAPAGLTLAETLTFGALVSATDPVSVIAVFTELRVDPKLFYLVFGESVLNDAVGIVLFKTFSKFVGYDHGALSLLIGFVDFVVIFGGSMVLGALCALATALTLRCLRSDLGEKPERRSREERLEAARASRTLQLAVLVCAVYAPTFVAELVELSGIVATLFAAIGVRHWAAPNLESSPDCDAAKLAESLLGTLSHVADTVVFLYLGLSVPAKTRDWTHDYSHALTIWAILACLAGRALHVYPLSVAINRGAARAREARRRASVTRARHGAALESREAVGDLADPLNETPPPSPPPRRPKGSAGFAEPRPAAAPAKPFAEAADTGMIPPAMQHMLWFSGLRGAVAFSCAHNFPNAHGHRTLFATTTIMLIIASMYVLGALTVPVLRVLGIPTNCDVDDAGAVVAAPPTPQRRHSVSPSEAPPLAPLPLRTLQALDTYIYPWVVYTPPRFRPEEGENLVRRDDMEMVDVGLPQTDSKEGLLDADAPEGGEAKAMV